MGLYEMDSGLFVGFCLRIGWVEKQYRSCELPC